MQFCAEMLLQSLPRQGSGAVKPIPVQPPFRRRLGALPGLGQRGFAWAGDRMLNYFWDYPRSLKQQVSQFDWFHVVDHSYAQLVHALPPERTGVFCHDIDAFRCLLQPDQYPRSIRYRAMQTRILQGFQKAAVVFYTTQKVRQDIERYNLIDPARLVQAPLGTAPEFTPAPQPDQTIDPQVLARIGRQPFLLSVSSSKQRKRLDVLLAVFAAVRSRFPDLKLVRVGRGPNDWTAAHRQQIQHLGIADDLIELHGLERSTLAELYRQARLVLMTSEAEGFGLPVIEALACGSVVVASDLPVFQEVGGEAVVYAPVGEVEAWAEAVSQLLLHPATAPDRVVRLAQANQYSWAAHAQIIAQAYWQLGR
jgi:glycosyltransferase involved in cell wall biosynthesis